MGDTGLQARLSSLLSSALVKIITSDYNSAINELKAAEVLDRNNPEILYNLGICYCRMGLFKTALPYFNRILNMESAFVDVLTVKKIKAYCLIQKNELSEGRALLDEVLKHVPSDTTALLMKGYCLEKDHDYHGALKIYHELVPTKARRDAENAIAYILAQTGGELPAALEYASRAVQEEPDNPAYCDTLGFIYLKMGKKREAETYLSKARAAMPFSKEIQRHWDMLRGQTKKTKSDH